MRSRRLALLLAIPLLAAIPTPVSASRGGTGYGSYDHIFVVVFENKGYRQIVDNASAPNFNRLMKLGTLSTGYHAITHPSHPNYIAMTAGSTFGQTSDCSPGTCPISASNLASLLSSNGRTWKGYMESLTGTCGTADSGLYAARHNPFVYFNNIRTTSLCQNVVPYSRFSADLASDATTPRLSFIVPNACNDMHDCSVGTGDRWISALAGAIMASPAWKQKRSLLVVTFDEDNLQEDNRVATFAIGSPVRKSVPVGKRVGTAFNHYSLLHTIEYYLGVPTLGRNDASNAIMASVVPN